LKYNQLDKDVINDAKKWTSIPGFLSGFLLALSGNANVHAAPTITCNGDGSVTIQAESAIGSANLQSQNTATPLENGDFTIFFVGNNFPPLGDGVDEFTRWDFDFAGVSFNSALLSAARLNLTLDARGMKLVPNLEGQCFYWRR